VLASFAPPSAAFETPVKIATDVAIAFMFFLYGARLATANVIAGVAHWRLHALVLASTFVMFPAIGLVFFHLLPQWLVPGPLALGMLYLCLLPSTIQSSLAFTSIAGGNVPAAMCSATLSSLVGTVATPLFVGIFASARGGMKVGNWQVEAFCDNLFDAHPITNYEWSIDSQVPNTSRLEREFTFRPRTFGLTFIYRSK